MPQNKNFARADFHSTGSRAKLAGSLNYSSNNEEKLPEQDCPIEVLIGELGQLKLMISECPGTPNFTPYYVNYPQQSKFDQHEFFIGGMLSQIKSMPPAFKLRLREIFKGYIFQMLQQRTGKVPDMELFESYKPAVPMHYLDEEEIYYYSLTAYLKQLTTNELLRSRVYTLRNLYRMLTFLSVNHTSNEINQYINSYNVEPEIKMKKSKEIAKVKEEPVKPVQKQQEVLRISPSVWSLIPNNIERTVKEREYLLAIIRDITGNSFDFITNGLQQDSHGHSIGVDSKTGHILLLDSNEAKEPGKKRLIFKDATTGFPKLVTIKETCSRKIETTAMDVALSIDSLEHKESFPRVKKDVSSSTTGETGSYISVDECKPNNEFVIERCEVFNIGQLPFGRHSKVGYQYNTMNGAVLSNNYYGGNTENYDVCLRPESVPVRYSRQQDDRNSIIDQKQDVIQDFGGGRRSIRLDPLTGRVIPGDKENRHSTFYTRHVTRTYRVDAVPKVVPDTPTTNNVTVDSSQIPQVKKERVVLHEERNYNRKGTTTIRRNVSRFFTGLLGLGTSNDSQTLYGRRHFKRQQ